MGPPRYREFCLPLVRECAEFLHRKGKLLGTHLDGNNRPWARDVAEAPFDYIEAFTPAPDTDMTLREALDAWPDKVLWINFPSSLHLADRGRGRHRPAHRRHHRGCAARPLAGELSRDLGSHPRADIDPRASSPAPRTARSVIPARQATQGALVRPPAAAVHCGRPCRTAFPNNS